MHSADLRRPLISDPVVNAATCKFKSAHVDAVYPEDWELEEVKLRAADVKALAMLAEVADPNKSVAALATLVCLSEESVEKYKFECPRDSKHPLNGQFDVRAKKDLPAGAFVALYPGVVVTEDMLEETHQYIVTLSCQAYLQGTKKASSPTLYMNAQRPDGSFVDVSGGDAAVAEPAIAHAINASQTYGMYPSDHDLPTNCAYAFFCPKGQRLPIVFIQTLVPVRKGESLRTDYGSDYFEAQMEVKSRSMAKMLAVDPKIDLPVLSGSIPIVPDAEIIKEEAADPTPLPPKKRNKHAAYRQRKREASEKGPPSVSLRRTSSEGVLKATIFCNGECMESACIPGKLSRERVTEILLAIMTSISRPDLFIEGVLSTADVRLLKVSEILMLPVFRTYINSLALLEGLSFPILRFGYVPKNGEKVSLVLSDADKKCFEERLRMALEVPAPCAGAGSGAGVESDLEVEGDTCPFLGARKRWRADVELTPEEKKAKVGMELHKIDPALCDLYNASAQLWNDANETLDSAKTVELAEKSLELCKELKERIRLDGSPFLEAFINAEIRCIVDLIDDFKPRIDVSDMKVREQNLAPIAGSFSAVALGPVKGKRGREAAVPGGR